MTGADPKDFPEDYVATCEELQVIDTAMASIDAGEIASECEVEAAFAKFRQQA
jgi:hypothetical protein